MCACTPNVKTPWCGKPGCETPPQAPRVPPAHGDRPCGTVWVPIPDHMLEAQRHAREALLAGSSEEYGWNWDGQLCFAIDACIEPALRAVWAAGYKTLGCCCGHGQEAGGIITIDTGSYSATPRTGTQERYAEIHEAALAGRRDEPEPDSPNFTPDTLRDFAGRGYVRTGQRDGGDPL